jgi:hypothetical protein
MPASKLAPRTRALLVLGGFLVTLLWVLPRDESWLADVVNSVWGSLSIYIVGMTLLRWRRR